MQGKLPENAPENAPENSSEQVSTEIPPCKVRSFFRGCKIGATFTVLVILFPFFQNFSDVPSSFLAGIPLASLKPRFLQARAVVLAANEGSADIRDLAPRRPASLDTPQQVIAVPQSGTDMNSIGQDWASRQAQLITGGAEQRLLDDLNKKMTRLVRFEEVEGEPWPETGDSANDASKDGASGDGDVKPRGRKPASEDADAESRSSLRPKSMRFTALNRVEVGLTNLTSVSCSFTGNSMLWNVKSPIAKEMDVNLQHDTNGAKSTVNLNYKW